MSRIQGNHGGQFTNKDSPILYRFFYILTPPSELPELPPALRGAKTGSTDDGPRPRPSYIPIHLYTVLQIVITVGIFVITLTKAAPAFPILIIALVPFRLLLMKRWWNREVLRFVDAWACREGTPEDDEDEAMKKATETQSTSDALFVGSSDNTRVAHDPGDDSAATRSVRDGQPTLDTNHEEYIELESFGPRPVGDEEKGHGTNQ